MTQFTVHTIETAPEASKPLIKETTAKLGSITNLHAMMAEAPGLLEAYLVLHRLVLATSFSAEEKTVVWQAINVEHDCHYCVPAHTAIARMMKVDDSISNALRDETLLPHERLEALRTFTLEVVRRRGAVSDATLETFLGAGFTKRHVLEVVLAVSQKVMSNYTNHIVKTPVDPVFEKFVWSKSASGQDESRTERQPAAQFS